MKILHYPSFDRVRGKSACGQHITTSTIDPDEVTCPKCKELLETEKGQEALRIEEHFNVWDRLQSDGMACYTEYDPDKFTGFLEENFDYTTEWCGAYLVYFDKSKEYKVVAVLDTSQIVPVTFIPKEFIKLYEQYR